MMLCLDAGNSRVKWGLRAPLPAEGVVWASSGVLAHAQLTDFAPPGHVTRIVAANVAGAVGTTAIGVLAERLGCRVEWVCASAAGCGVVNRYTTPAQLGADRWAALVAARMAGCGPCVVVLCGTATTIDLLDDAGIFLGGLILPGLEMMRAALANGTADLPATRGAVVGLPRNTFDAIASGSVAATLGAIERMARHLDPATVLLSGGAAPALAGHLDLPHRVVDNLVLEGVARCAVAL